MFICCIWAFILFCIPCDYVPLKCSPFHSTLVSLQSLYTADSRKCKSLSPKWHSPQGPEGQYMMSINLNQRRCSCLFVFSGERAEGGYLNHDALAFPSCFLKWENDEMIMHGASFSLLIYRLNIHHSKKGSTIFRMQVVKFPRSKLPGGLGWGWGRFSSVVQQLSGENLS